MSISITEDTFGSTTNPISGADETVKRFTFANENGISVQVITYGATITSIRCPDKFGNVDDIVLGFDELEGILCLFFQNRIMNWRSGRRAPQSYIICLI